MTQLDPQLDPQVLEDVLALIDELSGDWEFDGEITPETRFLADLGLESLDLVVLGTMIQQRYGQLPFAEYYAEVGQRPIEERDVSVADLVGFICSNRAPLPSQPA
jgi:acyl carrier protein